MISYYNFDLAPSALCDRVVFSSVQGSLCTKKFLYLQFCDDFR